MRRYALVEPPQLVLKSYKPVIKEMPNLPTNGSNQYMVVPISIRAGTNKEAKNGTNRNHMESIW